MKKVRFFKCKECKSIQEDIVSDDIKQVECLECKGDAAKTLSAPKCFNNTTGKSPAVSKR